MQVSVTLFGGLRHYLPPGSSFNKCSIAIENGASLEALLEQIPIPADKPFLVIFNDEKVDAEDYAGIKVGPDDDVVLLPPIKGG
jgi:sulfur carrier protein ThiS